jgi:hypothetical protein
MTVYQVKDRNGNILRYQARIERKATGKMRMSFGSLEEAISWVTGLHHAIPCKSAGWAHQTVKVRDLPVHGGDGRGGLIIKNQPRMEINGCTLVRSGMFGGGS